MADPISIAYGITSSVSLFNGKIRPRPELTLGNEALRAALEMYFSPEDIADVWELMEDVRDERELYHRGTILLMFELDDGYRGVGIFGYDSPGAIDRLTKPA